MIEEKYLNSEIKNPENFSIVLKKNEYCVLGDNRQNSIGSVQFGAIKKNQIKYKFLFTLIKNFKNGNIYKEKL